MSCEHCNGPGSTDIPGTKCCWERAMEIKKFKALVKKKYIIEVIFDLLISVTSVATDIIALLNYLMKEKYAFAILTMIPVLLPTFVFTNVYLDDGEEEEELTSKRKLAPVSRIISVSGKVADSTASQPRTRAWETSMEDSVQVDSEQFEFPLESDGTDSSIRSMNGDDGVEVTCREKCFFHCPTVRRSCRYTYGFWSGCAQCCCNKNHELRRKGALAMKNSMQRMFKYGFGTFVLRFIAWAWYIKAIIYGVKAYKEPKRFMKIETPNRHWSYELLVRLDFLQAALENAPQCVIQLYALITQPDEDQLLGILTLAFSFIDFIRISVSVHWDMGKGPVIAPGGCYDTWTWKFINTSSWIFIYSARSAAIALILATSGFQNPLTILPAAMLVLHIIVFTKVLSKAEYGVAGQKIIIAVFISLFFLPELDLDTTVVPTIIQFYYATTIIQNAFFIIPWTGFDKEYCFSTGQYITRSPTGRPTPQRPSLTTFFSTIGISAAVTTPTRDPKEITAFPTSTEPSNTDHAGGCLIDPTLISLAVPMLTITGVIFRLVSSQKMANYKRDLLPAKKVIGHNKLETSVANIFNKSWTTVGVSELFSAFSRMLKKEVIIIDRNPSEPGLMEIFGNDKNKRFSFLNSRLQTDFLASQTFIRESFSLMTRTTRSHDVTIEGLDQTMNEEDLPPEYSSDSELTFRTQKIKKRPRVPRSRNVSESVDVPEVVATSVVEVDLPSGSHMLEMCWI
ncbi:unnamed protein product [Orchesella dallaii]|uniref:XK-related protein n=1 Tax=Orchesella dallaii TaxID=48710 RepID=A0ABP1QB68_9HEXA